VGNTEPQYPQAEHPQAATAAAPGPRVAAARTRQRRKRALVIAAATGVTLVVAGTATAAVITGGGAPETTVNAAAIPDAEPDPLTGPDTPAAPDPALTERADEAVASATQATTADGSAVPEEPEEEAEQTGSSDSGESAPSTGGTPTGEGGTCEASFYGDGFHGATTASGETFDTYGMTAAHKTLPFDTMVQVTNPDNGKSVTVRINDRGPFVEGRCLDLSTAAFDEIIGTGAGVGTVEWQVVN
jgi:rare lipoprotein A